MAYSLADQPGPFGISVDQLIKQTGDLNTSFDNNAFIEALQNTCMQPPGKNLPIWPKGLATYARGQLDKPAAQNINAQIASTYGRPFIPDMDVADSGLFLKTDQMMPHPTHYPEPGPQLPLPSPPRPATDPTPPTPPPCLDCDCGLDKLGAKGVLNFFPCMIKSLRGFLNALGKWSDVPGNNCAEKVGHLFTDNSRIFYLIAWIVVILFLICVVKKIGGSGGSAGTIYYGE